MNPPLLAEIAGVLVLKLWNDLCFKHGWLKGHVIAVALSQFQTNYTSSLRKCAEMVATFCNTCQKVLVTVKNIHTSRASSSLAKRNVNTQLKRVVCSDDFNRKVECLFIFRSLHSLRQWFSEFVEKSIWLHENAENYHSQKKDDSSSDIIWA